jgi:hypothetical protein
LPFSLRQHFISNKVQSDDLRRFHGLIELTPNRVPDHGAQLFEGLTLGVDAVTQRGSGIPAVRLVLMHLKYDLAHPSTSCV